LRCGWLPVCLRLSPGWRGRCLEPDPTGTNWREITGTRRINRKISCRNREPHVYLFSDKRKKSLRKLSKLCS
jgi:hypothetical protein